MLNSRTISYRAFVDMSPNNGNGREYHITCLWFLVLSVLRTCNWVPISRSKTQVHI